MKKARWQGAHVYKEGHLAILNPGKEIKAMGKNVQISKALLNALYRYHVCGDKSDATYIKDELADKMNRHLGRIMYGQAKTGETEEIRNNAMMAYKKLQKR